MAKTIKLTMVDVRCPTCGERGEMAEVALGSAHVCRNCRQTIIPVPRPTHVRRLIITIQAIAIGLVILWALGIILDKLS